MAGYKLDPLVTKGKRSDVHFLVCVMLLLGLGSFTQYFCTQDYAERLFGDAFYFIKRQGVCLLIGISFFLFFSLFKLSFLRKALPFIFLFTLILSILTFIPSLSVEKNGARRWIKMPLGFTLQSSEVVKFTIILFLANLFDKERTSKEEDEVNILPAVIVLIIFTAITLLQKDLSTALFIFLVSFLLFFLAGFNIKWIFAIALLAIPALMIFITSEQYRLDRIIAFVRPEYGLNTINYQSMAAKRAISAGGLWGSGIGVHLIQYSRIPEVQADYIYASWVEAMGFAGVALYLVILIFFTYRGARIALEASSRFASYASMGFILMISLQSLFNIAIVAGILPSTGIPLPFFSLGGSSIIVTLSMCGVILNSSRAMSNEEESKEEGEEGDDKEVTFPVHNSEGDSIRPIDSISNNLYIEE